jgi:integrator complex subunit 9
MCAFVDAHISAFQSGVSRDVPIYFISPVAKASLAYAGIFAEWLSKDREDKVYIPEEPFIHSEVSRNHYLPIHYVTSHFTSLFSC